MTEVIVGVDVGGSSTEAAAWPANDGNWRDGEPLARHIETTRATGGEGITRTVLDAVAGVMAQVGGGRPATIGVGVPGQVDPGGGTVALAVNLGIDGTPYPLGRAVANALSAQVTVENDVRAAALGTYLRLAPTDPHLRHLALLSIGTGIAAGVVLDGKLHRGRDGMAGEIGHAPIASATVRCACGLLGCLEAVAAGPAIARAWPTPGGAADDLFAAALAGEPRARAIADPILDHLATGVMWLVAAYAPDLVVLGGGVGAGAPLLELLRAVLAARSERSELARRVVDPQRLLSLPPQFAAGALGAAALATQTP